MQYRESIPFAGDPAKAFDMATTILTGNGFRIVEKGEHSLAFSSPGMSSTKQNPLLGASEIRVERRVGELEIQAELGGVQRMRTFLILFPIGLALFLFVLFGILFREKGILFTAGVSVGPLLPWVVLTPLLSAVTKRRTERALTDLLANMDMAGR